jgi:hypothetical protein
VDTSDARWTETEFDGQVTALSPRDGCFSLKLIQSPELGIPELRSHFKSFTPLRILFRVPHQFSAKGDTPSKMHGYLTLYRAVP